MRILCTLRRLLGATLLALVLVPAGLGVTAAEAGKITHSFIH